MKESPVINLSFGDVQLKFQVFVDDDGLERAYFDVSASNPIKYKGKEYEPFNGRYYVNNLYRLYLILHEGLIQSKKLDPYRSKVKKDNKEGYAFNIRRARINQDQRAEILKDFYNYYINSTKNLELNMEKAPEEEETVFDVSVPELTVASALEVDTAQVKDKHKEAVEEAFSQIGLDLSLDMYSVFSPKFIRKHPIISIYYAFFPRRRLIFEFRENKTPVKYARIFVEMHQIMSFIELIESFLQNLEERKRVVYPYVTSNGTKPNPVVINKEGNIRKLSILPVLNKEAQIDYGEYLILKNALKDYVLSGVVPKAQVNADVGLFIGERYPYLQISGKKFRLEGRKHALEFLYNLL